MVLVLVCITDNAGPNRTNRLCWNHDSLDAIEYLIAVSFSS